MDKEKGKIYIMEENHYYPFGLKHEKYNSDKYEYVEISKEDGGYLIGIEPLGPQQRRSYQYKYNGKEFQDEMGLNVYAYGWRDYDPAIGRFMKIDRFAEKYHPISPYSYTANNPLKYMDIKGDSLRVANTQITKDYLNSAVNEKNQQYINYDDNGNVSLNFGNMTDKQKEKALKNDSGLSIINDMINATDKDGNSENFFFEASNRREGSIEGKSFNLTLQSKSGEVTSEYSWVSNFSTTSRGDGLTDVKPPNGFDGAVFISPGRVFGKSPFGNQTEQIDMGKIVKHELRENYFRTHDKKPYKEAHESAAGQKTFTNFIFD